jgi:FAD/FMN-containing dehydrogenase
MSQNITRRGILRNIVTATAVVAFNPISKVWASEEEVDAEPGEGVECVPPLDGQLIFNPTTLTTAADDFGHIIHQSPWAILVPGSVKDIRKMVKFARRHGLSIAGTRGIGQSHSTYGQAQVDAGIIIDMSALQTIGAVNGNSIWVQAGTRWSAVLQATLPQGKSPPTLTDYIELSVGGTLSAGGIGGQSSRHGLQVDNVLELEVVTGKGKFLRCSPTYRRQLFDAVRSGLGQFGIIVRAKLRLVDVPPMVRVYTAVYGDINTFTNDQMMLADNGRFDYLEGFASHLPGGGFIYILEAVKYFSPSSPPNNASLTSGLSFLPGSLTTSDQPYFDFVNRLAPTVAFLQSVGAWQLPHPWIDVFVPGTEAASFIGEMLAQTTEASMGQGPILIYPVRRDKVNTPFLQLPDDEHFFLFSLLRTAFPPTPANIQDLLAQNRNIYDALVEIGGKRYPIGAVELTQADWQTHFGDQWSDFVDAKDNFDPDYVLTPGQKIF